MKFKPGTLVKLAAEYSKYLGWTYEQEQDEYPDFWFDQTHIGLIIEQDYDNRHVRILVGETIITINPKVLQEY